VVNAAPAVLAEVLSPEWLTGVLDDLGPGQSVLEARLVDDYTTVLSKVRFEVVVGTTDGGRELRQYCVKGSFGENRVANLEIEGRFLREVAPRLGLRVPQCHYVGVDQASGRSLFIMNDLVAQGVTFLNSESHYSREMTAASLGQLARLHAGTWGPDRREGLAWLEPDGPPIFERFPNELLQRQMDDGRSAGLPPELRDPERLKQALRAVYALPPVCVAHGDPHSLNAYLDRDGQPGFLDWQLAHVGHWATDVAYHLATVLEIEARRADEEGLLRHYLDQLAAFGVEPPPWDEAWRDYCTHAVYGYLLWNLAQMTPRVDILAHIPRLGTALLDHDAFALLGVD
jgi:Phosphotransferase enzyme family